jgi:hypothetical protein
VTGLLTLSTQGSSVPPDELLSSVGTAPRSAPPSVSSVTEPSEIPSIRSTLETVPSEGPSGPSLTDEVERVLDYLREIDDARGDENRALAENIEAIRDELGGLSDFLRARLPVTFIERPPPVPQKDHLDRSIGPSIVSPAPAGPKEAPVRATATHGVEARHIPIPMTPRSQWSRPSSPSSLSETVSFLSSHHSDDLSLLEAEAETYPVPRSPSWSEPSAVDDDASFISSDFGTEDTISQSGELVPTSSTDISISEVSIPLSTSSTNISNPPLGLPAPPLPMDISISRPTSSSDISVSAPSEDILESIVSPASTAESLGSTPTLRVGPAPISEISDSSESAGTYLSRSSSPSDSTISSDTVRQTDANLPGANLPQLVGELREQIDVLKEGQVAANDVLNELRERAMAPEIVDKLAKLEDMLNSVLDRSRRPPRPPTDTIYSDDDSMASSALSRLRDRWEEQNEMRDEPPTIYMPTPLPARPTLDEQLEALLSSVPPLPPVAAQGPPPLIPLVYRPVPRARRARSPSPVSLRTLPDRADTAPPTEYPGDWRPRLRGPKRREPRQQLGDRDATSIMTDAPTEYTYTAPTEPGTSVPSQPARSRRGRHNEGPDIDFEARLRELRRGRRGGDGVMNYEMGSRPSTAVSVTVDKRSSLTCCCIAKDATKTGYRGS